MLRALFDKYKCDKGYKHSYEEVYEPEFAPIREEELNILEIGIFKGASTQAWLEYFPNAKIYCVDLFDRVPMLSLEVVGDPRVSAIQGSSMSYHTTTKMNHAWPDVKFDIIIDDGKHTPDANRETFDLMFPYLKEDGSYYIEDVFPLDIMTQKELLHPWVLGHSDDYNIMKMMKFLTTVEKHNVTRFDNRTITGEPDSYIFKVTQ